MAKKTESKKVTKKATKATASKKKEAVKRTPVDKVVAMDRDGSGAVRKLFNKVLSKHKNDLVLRENAHGAVQVVRTSDSSLMFSMRSDGKLLLTAPIFEKSGKKKVRVHKHPGNKWDHMSMVPFKSVTLSILEDRIKDPKSSKQHHDAIYSKKPEASGLVAKSARAKKVIEETKKSTKAKKNVMSREKKSAAKKSGIKRSPVKKSKSKIAKAATADVAAS